MRITDIIEKKRDGNELSEHEIAFFIKQYTAGGICDYQASALLMAMFIRGMSERETVIMTKEMTESGDTVNLSEFGALTVDKHSTGGVGDKTTIAVAPIVASLGCVIAKMSGRGLGHTGGTVDKLESIRGYNTSLSSEAFYAQVRKTGIAVAGQSGNFVPADKKLYALRDVTATVDNPALIAASIMSKKLAAGAHNIVLDVKTGSGAFMKNLAASEALARIMVSIGKACGRNTSALITDMNEPLGKNIGNSLEVVEAVSVLQGKAPKDLSDLCVAISSEMVSFAKSITRDEAEASVREAVSSGKAFEKMLEWVSSQGGDTSLLTDITRFPRVKYAREIIAKSDGYIASMETGMIGKSAMILGAGRFTKDDTINHAAGIIVEKKLCDSVKAGDLLATLYTDDCASFTEAEAIYRDSLVLSETKPEKNPLIYEIIR